MIAGAVPILEEEDINDFVTGRLAFEQASRFGRLTKWFGQKLTRRREVQELSIPENLPQFLLGGGVRVLVLALEGVVIPEESVAAQLVPGDLEERLDIARKSPLGPDILNIVKFAKDEGLWLYVTSSLEVTSASAQLRYLSRLESVLESREIPVQNVLLSNLPWV